MNPQDIARMFNPPGFADAVEAMQRSQNQAAARKSRVEDSTNFTASFHRASLASAFAKNLKASILRFDASLDAEHEVGMRLVSFGQTITFHVEDVRYHDPGLIFFQGVTDDGNRVELIQHTTQISFLLLALPKPDPLQPKRRFGFGPPESPSPAVADSAPQADTQKKAGRKSGK